MRGLDAGFPSEATRSCTRPAAGLRPPSRLEWPALPSASRNRYARRRAPIAETPVEQREGELLVWTDGACRGNPGPGGWAAIVVGFGNGEALELSGGEPHTTNNRME